MATKKRNEKKTPEVASLLAALPEGAVKEVDLTALKVSVNADVRELMVTAKVVVDRIPAPRTEAVEAACLEVTEAVELTARALEHNQAVAAEAALEEGGARAEVIALVKAIAGILEALVRTPVLEVATEGRALGIEILGEGFDPSALSARALFTTMQGVEARLAAHPALRARLVARVPEALLVQLQAANGRLGLEVGVGREQAPKVSMQPLRGMLRERLGHLVKVLAATAVLGDRMTALAVRKQLQPVIDLSVAVAPRRRATAVDTADESADDAPATPPAMPVPAALVLPALAPGAAGPPPGDTG